MAKNTATIDFGTTKLSCFVLMPFASAFSVLYEQVLKPAVEDKGLECIRGDEVFTKPQITHEIWSQIRSCRLVIAELTGKNPNVLYELGLAHAIGKPAITITRDEDDVPFDLRALRFLGYDTSDPFWGEHLRESLGNMIQAILTEPGHGPVFDGIDTDVAFPTTRPVPPKTVAQPSRNFGGIWLGQVVWGPRTDHWTIAVEQDGAKIAGTLTVTGMGSRDAYVVLENISGTIDGDRIRFNATSYSYVRQGTPTSYALDRFEGVMLGDGMTIVGRAEDEQQTRDDVVLRRNNSDNPSGNTAPKPPAARKRRTASVAARSTTRRAPRK